jgi:hypothetical protein
VSTVSRPRPLYTPRPYQFGQNNGAASSFFQAFQNKKRSSKSRLLEPLREVVKKALGL